MQTEWSFQQLRVSATWEEQVYHTEWRVYPQVNHKDQKRGQNLDSTATVPKEMPCLQRERQKWNEKVRGRARD